MIVITVRSCCCWCCCCCCYYYYYCCWYQQLVNVPSIGSSPRTLDPVPTPPVFTPPMYSTEYQQQYTGLLDSINQSINQITSKNNQ